MVSDKAAELQAELEAAETESEIYRALSRYVWHHRHGGKVCRPDCYATPVAIADLLLKGPQSEPCAEATDLMTRLTGDVPWVWRAFLPTMFDRARLGQEICFRSVGANEWPRGAEGVPVAVLTHGLSCDLQTRELFAPAQAERHVLSVERIHSFWCALPKGARPRHPLAPLVQAYLEQPPWGALSDDAEGAASPRSHEQTVPKEKIPYRHRWQALSQALRSFGLKPDRETAEAFVNYRAQLDTYRTRYKESGVPLSRTEAVELIQRFPFPVSNHPESLAVAALAEHCMAVVDGQVVVQREPTEGLLDEWQDKDAPQWNRFLAQEALDTIAGRALTRAFPDKRLNRPRGRHDASTNMLRDAMIARLLVGLQGCGLAVTARKGESLAGAMAEALDIPTKTIAKVWENSKLRTGKRSRNRTVPCEQCGTLIPKFEALWRGSRCSSCSREDPANYATLPPPN